VISEIGDMIPLTNAGNALEDLEKFFGGLKAWQLDLFEVVNRAGDVLEFFR